MRIYVANAQTVQFRGAVLHFGGGSWYDLDDDLATTMLRDQVAETPEQHAARLDAGLADPPATEAKMHPPTTLARRAAPVEAAPAGPAVMHPATNRFTGKPFAEAPAAAIVPPILDPDSDATGVKELVVDPAPEFAQTSAPADEETPQ